MTREVAGLIKSQTKGGATSPSPLAGPVLGSKGINIMGFCKKFNARTQDKAREIIPTIITYYTDKSFDSVLKAPPAAVQPKEMAKLRIASAQPNRQKVASIAWDQVRTIAEDKMTDLGCFTVESAMRLVADTARNAGITVEGEFPGNS